MPVKTSDEWMNTKLADPVLAGKLIEEYCTRDADLSAEEHKALVYAGLKHVGAAYGVYLQRAAEPLSDAMQQKKLEQTV